MSMIRYIFLLMGLLAGVLGLGAAPMSAAQAQNPPEFDELDPTQFPDCPRAVETKFPKCAIAMLVTTDEKWETCYCSSNVKVESQPTFPNPKVKRRSAATFEKLVPQGGGPDPCALLTIGGRQQYVCW